MENTKKNVPDIRFPGFTDVWEQRKLLECIEKITDFRGRTPKKLGMDWSESGYLALSALNVKDGYIDFNQDVHYGNQELYDKWMSGNELHKGQVLFTTEAPMGNIAQVPDDNRYILSQRTIAFDVDESIITESFLATVLRTPGVQNALSSLSSGGTAKGVSQKTLNEVYITIPNNKEEQESIATLFIGVDNLITLHQRKCDELKIYKKGLLQQMFPLPGEAFPRVRFPGFTDPWEQRKLGDMVSFSKGSGYSKGDLKEDGTPIILYGRLYTKYETVISEVDTFADEKKGSVFSKGGEVIVPASGETAEDISIASVVEKSGILLGGDINIITPPDEMDSAFLAISISNGKPHNDMAKMAQGKSVVHLHNSDLEKIDLPYPNYDEQRRISGFFSDLDNLITLHQRKCDELRIYKKGLLQKMFV